MYIYQTKRTPAPTTPIHGDNNGFTSGPGEQRKLASKIYNGTLGAVAIGAGLTLLLVQTGILPVGDEKAQGNWVEIASQTVNGVFMWRAITSHPYYIVRLIMALRLLKTSEEQCGKQLGPGIRAARYLSTQFPLVFVHTGTMLDQISDHCEVQDGEEKTVENVCRLGNFLFLRNDVKYLRNALAILNCGCLPVPHDSLHVELWSSYASCLRDACTPSSNFTVQCNWPTLLKKAAKTR
ncbi:hypothetical protein V7S43_003140 [Phytophthora oleae]|uniref:Uncharacterized protein n=1 Tax=Phytophthora oleae TaxID=2107226 RepID=A0ABD3FWA7_9STRA